MKIGFMGLGNMGLPMARNLARAGHTLTAYNRNGARVQRLAGERVQSGATPAAAARRAEVLVTMLADDAAVEAVLFGADGAFDVLPAGAIHVSMSTISAEYAETLALRHAGAGHEYVSAPVFGRPKAAESANLTVVMAGPKAALDRLEPVLGVFGPHRFRIGDVASVANVVKLAGNFTIAAVLETLSETYALIEKAGVNAEDFLTIVNSALYQSPLYENYGRLIARQEFDDAGFTLQLGLKDLRLVLQAAERYAAPLPLASLVHDRLLTASARGMGNQDWSALSQVSRAAAGLE